MKHIYIILLSIAIAGCTDFSSIDTSIADVKSTLREAQENNKNVAYKKVIKPSQVPMSVANMLTSSSSKKESKKKFSFSINDMPASVFFSGLATGTKTNIVVDPNIKDNITLNLKNVTIDDVFKTIHSIYGYHITNNNVGYKIAPKQLETRIFLVNRMNINRKGSSSMTVSGSDLAQKIGSSDSKSTRGSSASSSASSSSSVSTTYNDSNFWVRLQQTIEQLIHKQPSTTAKGKQSAKLKQSANNQEPLSTEERQASKKLVSIDPNLGTVVVSAYPDELDNIEKYINTLQNLSDKQVIIEAKILDVSLNKHHREGLDLNLPRVHLHPNLFPSEASMIDSTIGYTSSLPTDTTNLFKIALNYISKQGDITILSSPRVSTMNNQKAVIKIGNDMYFAKDSSTTTTSSSRTSQTNSLDVTPIFSGVALDVTPEISADNTITLHIHPYISEVTKEMFTTSQRTNTGGLDKVSVMLPKVTVTESDTVVKARDGEVIVIGGLMRQKSEDNNIGIPGFRNIYPNRENNSEKREMVILLKPTVVKTNTWNNELKKFNKNIG